MSHDTPASPVTLSDERIAQVRAALLQATIEYLDELEADREAWWANQDATDLIAA
jgi:hypothetical protein